MPAHRPLARRILFLLLVLLAAAGPVRADVHTAKPAKEVTNIGCGGGDLDKASSMKDKTLAKKLHDALGNGNFHSLIVVSSGCHSGGLVTELKKAFANATRPVFICSACKWDSCSNENVHTNEQKKNANGNFFSGAYWSLQPGKSAYASGTNPAGTNRNPKQKDVLDKIPTTDTWKMLKRISKKDGTTVETVQYVSISNGNDIKLGDGVNNSGSGAAKYKAILFGDTDGSDGHWNNLCNAKWKLEDSGFPVANMKRFYADGKKPENFSWEKTALGTFKAAARDSLYAAIAGLQPDSTTQVFLYLSCHGSLDEATGQLHVPASPVQGAATVIAFAPSSEPELADFASEFNRSGPFLELDVAGIGGPIASGYEVYFNSAPVNGGNNLIPSGSGSAYVRFEVDSTAVSPDTNYVWIRNANMAADSLLVTAYLTMGDVDEKRIGIFGGRPDPYVIDGGTPTRYPAARTPMGTPKQFAIMQNSPNPFSARGTDIGVALPRSGNVTLEVFDVAGRKVFAQETSQPAGWQTIRFEGNDAKGQQLATGVYFYRVSALGLTETRRMVIVR